MRARTSILALAAGVVVVVGANAAIAAVRASSFAHFWAGLAHQPAPADAVRIVALGDSATVAVGASDPLNGFVGRIAQLVKDETGRPVHIANLAVGGATAGQVLRNQVPVADLANADVVIYCSSNDLERRIPLTRYRSNLDAIADAVPAAKTVFSDFPLEPGRKRYQAVLAEIADARGIARADFAAVFNGEGRRLDIFSALPPHLNDLGYQFWFEAFRPPVAAIVGKLG